MSRRHTQIINGLGKTARGFAIMSKDKGFTIIEVMIVLVIAAAIILIVFLAVPSVQRNMRNTQRKEDASRVLAAAQEWRTLNANAMPHCNDMASRVQGEVPPCAVRSQIEALISKLSFYPQIWSVNQVEYASIMYESDALSNSDVLNLVGDSVLIRSLAACGPQNNLQAGSGLVVMYSQETGSGIILKCVG